MRFLWRAVRLPDLGERSLFAQDEAVVARTTVAIIAVTIVSKCAHEMSA